VYVQLNTTPRKRTQDELCASLSMTLYGRSQSPWYLGPLWSRVQNSRYKVNNTRLCGSQSWNQSCGKQKHL